MGRFGESLIVTLTGLAVVFFGLVVLMGLIKVLVAATKNIGKPKQPKQAAKPAEPAPAPAPVAAVAEPVAAANDDALIAVITAAVACMMDDGAAFTVRRVRRISNTPAWQKAGREEQIYSRF